MSGKLPKNHLQKLHHCILQPVLLGWDQEKSASWYIVGAERARKSIQGTLSEGRFEVRSPLETNTISLRQTPYVLSGLALAVRMTAALLNRPEGSSFGIGGRVSAVRLCGLFASWRPGTFPNRKQAPHSGVSVPLVTASAGTPPAAAAAFPGEASLRPRPRCPRSRSGAREEPSRQMSRCLPRDAC